MSSAVQSFYERFREALKSGGALSLLPDDVRMLADLGAYSLLQDAENKELGIQCPETLPLTSLAISGSKNGKTAHRRTSGKSDATTSRLDRDTILALLAGTSKTPKEN